MFTKHPTKCNICGGLVKYIPNKEIYGKSYGSGFCYYCTNCGAAQVKIKKSKKTVFLQVVKLTEHLLQIAWHFRRRNFEIVFF